MSDLSDTRVYKIKPGQPYFEVGVSPDGDQLIMGIQLPQIVAVRFSPDGALRDIRMRTLPRDCLTTAEMSYAALVEWKAELQVTDSTICISPFFVEEHWIGTRDLPEHYQDVLDHPERYDEERRLRLLRDIQEWQDRGDFVFYWDEDYYLNRDGEVVSS